jgi:transcriptional regulator with XRE-family HTH domain
MDSHRGRTFGDYLRAELDKRDWNATQLATQAGVSQAIVSRWIRNETVPTIDNLRPLAASLNTTLLDLLVAAGILTPDEAGAELVLAQVDRLSDDELLAEVGRRMKGARPAPKAADREARPKRVVAVTMDRDHREPGRKRS